MIKEVKLPEIAESIEIATVISVSVSKGDKVKKDQTIAEMESDKAAFDLPSSESGTVKSVEVENGDEVKVGQTIITVEVEEEDEEGTDGEKEEKKAEEEKEKDDDKAGKEEEEEEKEEEEDEDEEEGDREGEKDEEEEKEDEEEKEKPKDKDEEHEDVEEEEDRDEADRQEEEEEEKSGEKAAGKRDKEVPASPSVRRLAREIGVDIYEVEGTGPYDRIMAEDVKSYARSQLKEAQEIRGGQEKLPDFSSFGETERKPMDNIRKRTAIKMTSSWQQIPHVFQFDRADITEMEKFRKDHAKKVEEKGGALTVTALLLKITAIALEKHPKFNASLDMLNEEVVYKKYINIGVAVDTDRGLIVPVIRDPDRKSITDLSIELKELAEKTRNKKITPDVLQGGNFAISNLGGIGGTGFTPIVYQPNVAILGISRAETLPVFMDGEFHPRLILPLSLSYDHRLIDGAEAARFLRWICEAVEDPILTLF